MIWNMFIEFLQVQSRFNFSIFFSPVNILEMYLPSNFSDCSMATLSKRFFISFEIAFTSPYFSEKGKFWWKSIFNWHGIRFNFSFWQKFSKKAFFKKKYDHQVFWASFSGIRSSSFLVHFGNANYLFVYDQFDPQEIANHTPCYKVLDYCGKNPPFKTHSQKRF